MGGGGVDEATAPVRVCLWDLMTVGGGWRPAALILVLSSPLRERRCECGGMHMGVWAGVDVVMQGAEGRWGPIHGGTPQTIREWADVVG